MSIEIASTDQKPHQVDDNAANDLKCEGETTNVRAHIEESVNVARVESLIGSKLIDKLRLSGRISGLCLRNNAIQRHLMSVESKVVATLLVNDCLFVHLECCSLIRQLEFVDS